jgi:P4 family phage/plasmid primase-like protien
MDIYCDTRSCVKEALSFGFKPILLGERIKNPIEKGYVEKYSSMSEKDLAKEANRRQGSNVGILLRDILCIDIDLQNSGTTNWEQILEENKIKDLDSIETPIVRTGSSGRHYYFHLSPELKGCRNYLKKGKEKVTGIDVKHTGFLVYPGSVYGRCGDKLPHKCGALSHDLCLFSGKVYEWVKRPDIVPIAPVPKWLYSYLVLKTTSTKREFRTSTDLHKFLPYLKNRADIYNTWRDMIWCIRALGYDEETAHEFSKLSASYDPEGVDKVWEEYDPEKANWSWGSIFKWLKEDLPEDQYTSLCKTYCGNAELALQGDWGLSILFVNHIKDRLKLTDSKGNGYYYNPETRLWEKIYPEFICNIVSTTLRDILKEIVHFQNDDKLYKPILSRVLTTAGASAIIRQSLNSLYDKNFMLQLNRPPDYLPIKNGNILNLTTLEVRERTDKDLFSIECPVEYKPSKSYKVARDFFMGICCQDEEYVEYLRSLLAYFMSGRIRDRRFYIFVGSGMNGKSTLIRLVQHMLGDFYTSLSDAVMISQEKSSSCTPELVPLLHSRLGILPENRENVSLNSERVKAFTGDDTLVCRPLYMEQFTFTTQSKLGLMTNHLPRFNGADKAMNDRLVVLPFNNTFSHDPEFKDRLFSHIDEIFSYIVSGKWSISILPDKIKEARNAYIYKNDLVGLFIEDCYELEKEWKEKASDIYSEYKRWCEENSNEVYSSKKFFSIIEQRLVKKRTNSGILYIGIKRREDS